VQLQGERWELLTVSAVEIDVGQQEEERSVRAITFAEAEAKSPRIATLSEEVRRALLSNEVWTACEPYLYGTAQTGSTQFNHANVVREIRAWDKRVNRGRIGHYGLTDMALWKVVDRQLKHHFDMSRGTIVGLLEDKRSDAA
jgi:hypothetical protein